MGKKHFLKSASSLYLNFIITGVFGYLIRIIYARNLSIEEYGLFYAVLAFVGFISAFRDLGLSESLSFFIPRWKVKDEWQKIKSSTIFVITVELLISSIACLFIYLFHEVIIEHIFDGNTEAFWFLIPLSIWFIIRGLIEPITWLLKALQEFIFYSWSHTIALGTILCFSIFSFLYFPEYFSFAWTISALVVFLYYLFPLSKIDFHKTKFSMLDKKTMKEMFKYSLPLILVISSSIILSNFNTISLSILIGLQSVALYHIALPVANIMSDAFNPIIDMVAPIISESKAKNDLTFIKKVLQIFYNDFLSLSLPLIGLGIIFSNDIINIIFGSKFSAASALLQVLLIVGFVKFFSRLNLTYISYLEKATKLKAKISVISLIIHVVLVLVFTYFFGLYGMVIALFLSAILTFSISLYHLKQKIEPDFTSKRTTKIVLTNLLIFTSIYYYLGSYILDSNFSIKIFIIIFIYLFSLSLNLLFGNINLKLFIKTIKQLKR